jgi:hypothetical protein
VHNALRAEIHIKSSHTDWRKDATFCQCAEKEPRKRRSINETLRLILNFHAAFSSNPSSFGPQDWNASSKTILPLLSCGTARQKSGRNAAKCSKNNTKRPWRIENHRMHTLCSSARVASSLTGEPSHVTRRRKQGGGKGGGRSCRRTEVRRETKCDDQSASNVTNQIHHTPKVMNHHEHTTTNESNTDETAIFMPDVKLETTHV